MSEIIIRLDSALASQLPLFHQPAAIVADSLSPTSRRVYDCNFLAWPKFAGEQGFNINDVSYGHVRSFIHEADLAKTTRQNRLGHMCKLLRDSSGSCTDSRIPSLATGPGILPPMKT